jgi:hypothetical protein
VHESLRTYLRREVPPERVWQALEAAMLGNNESARVSASRVLMDALAEPEQDKDEQRKADFGRAGAEARQYLAEQLDRRAHVLKAADVQQVRSVLEEVARPSLRAPRGCPRSGRGRSGGSQAARCRLLARTRYGDRCNRG